MKRARGFTLIELMIVVAIIGILAAVATGKFSDLVTRSKEGRIKNNLGTLRSALNVYYGDQQFYPSDPATALIAGQKYLASIPVAEIPIVSSQGNPGHSIGNTIGTIEDDNATGNWAYIMNSDQDAQIFVNCSHNDSHGSVWTSH